MSYFDELADDGPVSREIVRGKKTKTAYFRKVTAGERLKLVSGQKMVFGDDKRGSLEMDLGDLSRNRHMLVMFSCVTEDGKPVFKNIDAVQAEPDWLIAELHKNAQEINADEPEEAGNA